MKVFLTGGTGYLGAEIARALLDADHEVVALVRDKRRAAELLGSGAELCEGRVEATESWTRHLADCDALIHTAAKVAAWGAAPEEFDRVNVAASIALVEKAQEFGMDRILATGSLFALGPSAPGERLTAAAVDRPMAALQRANDYVRTKAVAARRLAELQRAGSPVIQLFPTVLIGPGRRTEGNHVANVFSDIGRKRHPGLVGNGLQEWNLVPVESAARAHVQALEQAPEGQNFVVGGEEWTQESLVRAAAEAFGVKPPLRKLGRRLPLAVAAVSETVARITRKPPLLTRAEVVLYDAHWAFDSTRAREAFEYDPAPVEPVIRETVRWIRDDIWPREEGA